MHQFREFFSILEPLIVMHNCVTMHNASGECIARTTFGWLCREREIHINLYVPLVEGHYNCLFCVEASVYSTCSMLVVK